MGKPVRARRPCRLDRKRPVLREYISAGKVAVSRRKALRMEKTYRIRVEWGGLTSYVDSGRFFYTWDGSARVSDGKLLSARLIETRHFGHFIYRESWIPLPGASWRSRTEQSVSGVLLDVHGGPETAVTVITTQRTVAFRLSELLKRRYLQWPVGAKYSGVWISATFQGEGPFSVDAAVDPGCLNVRLEAEDFKGADRYGLFNTHWAAWLLPGKEVRAAFHLPRKPFQEKDRRSAVILELRLSLADGMDKPWTEAARYSPLSLELNDRAVPARPAFFRVSTSCWKGNQWIEFVPVDLPPAALKSGTNRLTVRNESGRDVLTIVSAQIRETIHQDFEITAFPRWLLKNEPFEIGVRCLNPRGRVRISCEGASFHGDEKPDLAKGVNRLRFHAGDGSHNASIVVSSEGIRRRLRIPVYDLALEEPSWKVGGTLQNVKMDDSGELDSFIEYCHDTRMGNYLCFRLEPGTPGSCAEQSASEKDWRRWARTMAEHNIFFSMISGQGWRNVRCEPMPTDERMLEACRILKEEAPSHFFSTHFHEYSRWIYAMNPGVFEEAHGPDFTMQDARDLYVKSVAGIEGIQGIPRQSGQAAPLMHYDYAGGIDYIAVETMALNAMHLVAAARGAARAWDKKTWGVHNATYWVKAPEDRSKLRLNYINCALTYLSGGNFLISEDGHTGVMHGGTHYGFHSEEPTALREILRKFHRYVHTHPRKGRPKVNLAAALGNLACETISFPLDFLWLKEQMGHVWGNKGGNQPKWNYGDPERGLILLDEWMPYWQDGQHIRHWFTGTPYGPFDVVPMEKADRSLLKNYRVLVFLGWNTMTEQMYATLRGYVEHGGTLFMALPHLSRHNDRAFLADMADLDLVCGGDFRDLFGVRILGKGQPMWRTTLTRTDEPSAAQLLPRSEYVISASKDQTLAPADLQISSARVLLKDSATAAPILAENRLGSGTALLLTTFTYPGKPPLQELVRDMLAALGNRSVGDVSLEDPGREVAWACWEDGSGLKNVYLLNTDWTVEKNVKECLLNLPGLSVPVSVREGNLTTVTFRDGLAVYPMREEAYVEDVARDGNKKYRLVLHGEGRQGFAVAADEMSVKELRAGGQRLPLQREKGSPLVRFTVLFRESTRTDVEINLE